METEGNLPPNYGPLLGPVAIREISAALGVSPTKKLGQNFLHDGGTVRRIVASAQIDPGDIVLEVGPGLGSLTLGLLGAQARVCAVEIDPTLAEQLPKTVAELQPDRADDLVVYRADALTVQSWAECAPGWAPPRRLVANLPYNVAVPILLHFLALLPTLESSLVMVQAEVADRLVAGPGSKTYGVPSVKVAWYGQAKRAGSVGRTVFWPAPNVDSALVDVQLFAEPRGDESLRQATFALVDAAFAQRRKMLRAALRSWVDSAEEVNALLERAQIDPTRRAETLSIDDFVQLGRASLTMSVSEAPLLAAARERGRQDA